MEKHILFKPQAWDFYAAQSPKVRAEFDRLIAKLGSDGRLTMPEGRKLQGVENLFEIRVKVSPNQYRILYCYVDPNSIELLSGFVKKTQETPVREIRKALKIRGTR